MRIGRPSPAMVVALIALIAALGGGAWALSRGDVRTRHIANGAVKTSKLGNNAVKTQKIARNAVKTPDVAASAITAAKIAAGAVNGGHVDEATLDTVPRVEGFYVIPLQTPAPSATDATEAGARAAAQRVELFNNGVFTIYAKCYKSTADPTNPGVHAEVVLEGPTGTVFESDENSSGNEFIDQSPNETDRELSDVGSFAGPGNPGVLNIVDHDATQFWAAAPGGFIEGDLLVGTKVGSPPPGDGVFGAGDHCLFGGTIRSG